MSDHYRRDGTPYDVLEWAEQFEKGEDRRVARTEVPLGDGEKAEVSTVFLGLDHSFGEGPPLIFETMVFGGELDQECERYTTEAQALEGHERMIARVQRTAKD